MTYRLEALRLQRIKTDSDAFHAPHRSLQAVNAVGEKDAVRLIARLRPESSPTFALNVLTISVNLGGSAVATGDSNFTPEKRKTSTMALILLTGSKSCRGNHVSALRAYNNGIASALIDNRRRSPSSGDSSLLSHFLGDGATISRRRRRTFIFPSSFRSSTLDAVG